MAESNKSFGGTERCVAPSIMVPKGSMQPSNGAALHGRLFGAALSFEQEKIMGGTDPIKVQAPWAMKRMETNLAGKIIVTDEKPTVDLLPDQPAPEQTATRRGMRNYGKVLRWGSRSSIFSIRQLQMPEMQQVVPNCSG